MKKIVLNNGGNSKPLTEKRRRARINYSLSNLKALILDSSSRNSKLEKADILELTVRYFQRHRNFEVAGLNKYQAGYFDCIGEVYRFLNSTNPVVSNLNSDIKKCLLLHLEECGHEINKSSEHREHERGQNGDYEEGQNSVWRPWETHEKSEFK